MRLRVILKLSLTFLGYSSITFHLSLCLVLAIRNNFCYCNMTTVIIIMRVLLHANKIIISYKINGKNKRKLHVMMQNVRYSFLQLLIKSVM